MCILPNFEPSDLEVLKRKGKKAVKNAEAETVEIVVSELELEEPV
jgi:hypothetical protein